MSGGNGEKVLTTFVTILSVAMAVGIFIVLPYFLSGLLKDYIRNESLMTIIEGNPQHHLLQCIIHPDKEKKHNADNKHKKDKTGPARTDTPGG